MKLDKFGNAPTGEHERGAALVEFALILPLVMSLVLGIVTGGAAYNRKISMTGAVREGSRFAATLDGSGTWANGVQSRTAELATGDLTTSQVCVALVNAGSGTNIYSLTPAGCSSVAAPSTPATSTSGCVVKVWAARPDKLQAMFFTSNLTLTAKSVARYEGTTTGC